MLPPCQALSGHWRKGGEHNTDPVSMEPMFQEEKVSLGKLSTMQNREARKKTTWGCECSGDGGGTVRQAAVRADELRVEEERVFTEMKMELCMFPLRSFAAKGLTE